MQQRIPTNWPIRAAVLASGFALGVAAISDPAVAASQVDPEADKILRR